MAIDRLYSKQMKIDDLTKEEQKELEKIQKEIIDEAKKVVKDYADNPTDISGSLVRIHENSPFLDSDENNEPQFSGSRWTKVIKNK
jgi:predicted YcjX-like family ATPase